MLVRALSCSTLSSVPSVPAGARLLRERFTFGAASIRPRSPSNLDGMRRSWAAPTWALTVVLVAGAMGDLAFGGDRVECEAQRVTGDGRYWSYRIVDGRECWYPGRPGKPKGALFWAHGSTPSAHQPVDQPEAETELPDPPSRLVAVPSEKSQAAEAMPEEWRATDADQLLAFTCCWPELEEPALLPGPTSREGAPPAWPLALLPLGLFVLWWIAKPRRELPAVRAGDADPVASRSLTRLHRHNGRNGVRESQEVSANGIVRERSSDRRGDEHRSARLQRSTGLNESATSLFVLPINEQQRVALTSLVDASDPMLRPIVRHRLVAG